MVGDCLFFSVLYKNHLMGLSCVPDKEESFN
uniref:Uncharacterized protein n=1 Tax=Rhizophora mucronata TaxID=61149 RepID=A0A2P2R3E0_RHIMU